MSKNQPPLPESAPDLPVIGLNQWLGHSPFALPYEYVPEKRSVNGQIEMVELCRVKLLLSDTNVGLEVPVRVDLLRTNHSKIDVITVPDWSLGYQPDKYDFPPATPEDRLRKLAAIGLYTAIDHPVLTLNVGLDGEALQAAGFVKHGQGYRVYIPTEKTPLLEALKCVVRMSDGALMVAPMCDPVPYIGFPELTFERFHPADGPMPVPVGVREYMHRVNKGWYIAVDQPTDVTDISFHLRLPGEAN